MKASRYYLAATAAVLLCASHARANSFSQAGAYNVFVFGNDSQNNVDVSGRLAVGGNITGIPGNETVGTNSYGAPIDSTVGYSLVVGGNSTYANNYINGSVFVGGNAAFTSIGGLRNVNVNGNLSFTNMSLPTGSVTYGGSFTTSGTGPATATRQTTASPIDFVAAQSSLTSLSTYLNAQAATTTALIDPYSHNITIAAGSGLTVVNLTGAQLAAHQGFTINGNGSSTVVVNVSGTSDTFSGAGYNLNGLTANQVVFNFASATSLTSTYGGIMGSILAPFADFNFAGGNVNGQIVVNNISGSGEAHNYLFTGGLPTPAGLTATPEPSTWFSFGGGFALLALVTKLRRLRACATR